MSETKNNTKILYPVDIYARSKGICKQVRIFARAFDAEILVAYATPAISKFKEWELPEGFPEKFCMAALESAKNKMAGYVAENFPGMKARGCILTGSPAEEIVRKAKDAACDMIIMARQCSMVNRILVGAVVTKVVRHAGTIPVITIGLNGPDYENHRIGS